MSEFKGTKGKWIISGIGYANPENRNTGVHYVTNGDEFGMIDIWFGDLHTSKTKEEALANAKLIGCAPEMLKMLIMLKDNHDLDLDHDNVERLIKKATEL